jgi:DNA-binding MarR family transcriptional regulator
MPDTTHDEDPVATRLAFALKHLRARLREESGVTSMGLSTSQLSILGRLRLNGPATAASLAVAEHVSQQAIAQSVAPLKTAGLVASEPDPRDRRKVLISITRVGLATRESVIASRDSWLARAIDVTVEADDRAALEQAIGLLERLADAEPAAQ